MQNIHLRILPDVSKIVCVNYKYATIILDARADRMSQRETRHVLDIISVGSVHSFLKRTRYYNIILSKNAVTVVRGEEPPDK